METPPKAGAEPVEKPWLDAEWRLDNFYSIVDKESNTVLFKRNNIQRMLSAVPSKRKMVLKARQVGISTQELIKQSDYTFFNDNKTCCILAHEQDAIEKLFRIPQKAYKFLPDRLKPSIDRGGGSKYEMHFPEINSRIYCDLESRGDTIHWLHISEYAFAKDPKRVKATIEAVPLGGIVTIESTANGMANDFYNEWMNVDSNYAKCFYPWFFHEEYFLTNHELKPSDLRKDEIEFMAKTKSLYKLDISMDQIAFRRFKQRELKHLFHQEYPEDDITCFLTSGNTPFDLTIIKPMYDAAKPPIREVNGIKIYEEYIANEIYVLGADTAEGIGGDYSCAHVYKVSNRKQVATFRGHLKPSDFGDKCEEMANLYSGRFPLLLAVERNNHGHAVLLKLDEILKYPNLFRHKPEEPKEIDKQRLGWITDKVTRPIMIDVFIESVENGTTVITDKQTLAECLTLINNNGKIEAEEPNHDDSVVASCIAVQMCIEESRFGIYSDIGNKIKI